MAIQMRRGEYDDFDASKMLAGELAVVVSGDPETEGGALYVATAAGSAERVAFADELPEDATPTSDGLMSAADKAKLDGVAAGAQANVIESISVNGTAVDVNNKNAAISIPQASSDSTGLMAASDKTKLDGIEAGANAYALPAATTSTLGGVKPDGTTVTADNDGTIHAAGSGTIPDGSITGVKIANDTIPDAKLVQTGGVLSEVHGIRTGVDGTAYASAGAAVRGQVIALQNSIYGVEGRMFDDGDAVTLQLATASNFVQNAPSGFINVRSTDASIYTGSINFIDLFGLAQGTFTDTHSGVVIEISGNEVHVHGSPSAGFRFDFQTGEFYTDSFANHPADFDSFPSDSSVRYRFCWKSVDDSDLPTNIYIASLNSTGTTLSADQLLASAHNVYMFDGQYFVMYSNAAIANLNITFKMGLKFYNLGTDAGGTITAVANAVPNTQVIDRAGYYECGAFTWTGASTTYDIVKATQLIKPNPLIDGHVYAWFGDSISQLGDLPNQVSDLLNVTVYDCSFAGAPLTYGDPTKYQPTGFMSLCSQIVAGDFTALSDALDAQQAAGTDVTEKRAHMATLEALDFDSVTDIVVFAGTNDFDNDYVTATNFVSGFSGALTTLLTAYPHLIVYVFAPIWRGDKDEGVVTIPTMEDLVQLEKDVADDFCLPFYDLYHRSGINSLTASVYLQSDILHPSNAGDALLANKCAKFLTSN